MSEFEFLKSRPRMLKGVFSEIKNKYYHNISLKNGVLNYYKLQIAIRILNIFLIKVLINE